MKQLTTKNRQKGREVRVTQISKGTRRKLIDPVRSLLDGVANHGALKKSHDPIAQSGPKIDSVGDGYDKGSGGQAGAAPVAQKEQTYKVKSGDTIEKITTKFNVKIEDLIKKNASKVKTWSTAKGKKVGFNAGETIFIPTAAEKEEKGFGAGLIEYARELIKSITGGEEKEKTPTSVPAPKAQAPVVQTPVKAAAKTPKDVIDQHNAVGTFGKGKKVTVGSTKRDQNKQLEILKGYCEQNKNSVNAYAEKTDWLKGTLDWEKFASCTVADMDVWVPFFLALYWGGGGPGVKSDKRTLPLVAAPANTTWKGKAVNASPHLIGKAMDVSGLDLKVLDDILQTKIPEFGSKGEFPINSTQPEPPNHCVHINFKNTVFS